MTNFSIQARTEGTEDTRLTDPIDILNVVIESRGECQSLTCSGNYRRLNFETPCPVARILREGGRHRCPAVKVLRTRGIAGTAENIKAMRVTLARREIATLSIGEDE